MKKLLLTGCIAFMAIPPAHSYPVAEWQCGDISVNIMSPRDHLGGPNETVVTLTGPGAFTRNKGRLGHHFRFHFTVELNEGEGRQVRMGEFMGWTGGKAYLNGKRCKDYVEEVEEVRPRPKEVP
jgi:hypothetical protein